MRRLWLQFVIVLLFAPPVTAQVPLELDWQRCLEDSQNFKRLPRVDEELGPMMALPKRRAELSNQVFEWWSRLNPFEDWRKQVTADQKEQKRIFERANGLIENCRFWIALGKILSIAQRAAAEPATWQAFLAQQEIFTEPKIFGNIEQLIQQGTALRQRMEQVDPTQPYARQMTSRERQWSEDVGKEINLAEEFIRWLEKRN